MTAWLIIKQMMAALGPDCMMFLFVVNVAYLDSYIIAGSTHSLRSSWSEKKNVCIKRVSVKKVPSQTQIVIWVLIYARSEKHKKYPDYNKSEVRTIPFVDGYYKYHYTLKCLTEIFFTHNSF